MQEDTSAVAKYEIPMIEFEGMWIEIFKLKNIYPAGVSRGIMSYVRFQIMQVSCVATIVPDSDFSNRKSNMKSLHLSVNSYKSLGE